LSSGSRDREGSIKWIVEKIRRGEKIDQTPTEPLFDNMDDTVPLFLQAALLDSLHDIWRLNSQNLLYRLGILMGQKLKVELGEKLRMEDVGTWEATVEQVRKVLELIAEKATVTKLTRLYARFETEGCPCSRMSFALDYCPQDILIEGIIAGFAQSMLDNPRVSGRHRYCVRRDDKGVCVHELQIEEDENQASGSA
jgi:hypothetical protein